MLQRNKKSGSFIRGFKVAVDGITNALRHELHIKIHCVAALIVIIFATILHVSLNDWIVLILLISLVIALELVNTAIERTVDLITSEQHPLAKQAKDIAAGAVLIMSIASVIIGVCIFLKYL